MNVRATPIRAETRRRIRIFLASPSDVGEERALLYQVVDRLRYERPVAAVVTLEVVSWDDPGGGVPLLASEDPQTTVDAARASPASCDIVIVIFWNRLGTALGRDHPGVRLPDPARSGTEWEYRLALEAAERHGSPKILVYRRSQGLYLPPRLSHEERDELLRQVDLVDSFFQALDPEIDGGGQRGFNTYERPEDFERLTEGHLRSLIHELAAGRATADVRQSPAEELDLWHGSPFPGLRSFTPSDRPIFFGRNRETAHLVDRLRASPFLAVVGASGSGKSSLVGAGLLPRLADGVLGAGARWWVPGFDREASRWDGLRVTPAEIGSDPFLPLAVQLAHPLRETPRAIASLLHDAPTSSAEVVRRVIHTTGHNVAVLFVDQFEELFTLVDPSAAQGYIAALQALVTSGHCYVVVTLRSDFYHQCLEHGELAHLLENGQYPLPAPDALYEIVARPADRAGLTFEEGLVDTILADTGHDPSALPLLAFTLDELYRRSGSGGELTFAAYQALGGVEGAVATRADTIFDRALADLTDVDVARIFRVLLEVDEAGRVIRRRARRSEVITDRRSARFVSAFTEARLLIQYQSEIEAEPTVFVAHEALFRSWSRLSHWIDTAAEDLRLLRKLQVAVRDWEEHGRSDAYLWRHERLEPVYQMVARLEPPLSEAMRTFIRPEYERVIESFQSPDTAPYRRQTDADRLLAIGEVSVRSVVSCLGDNDDRVREAAAGLLVRFGGPAVEPLMSNFSEGGPEERLARLTSLVRIADSRAQLLLVGCLEDPDMRIQAVAVGALEATSGEQGRAALERLASSSSIDARWRAAGALGAFGESAVPVLVRTLADPSDKVRRQAHEAILAIGAPAAPLLAQNLDDADRRHALRVAEALIGLGPAIAPVVEDTLSRLGSDGRELALAVLAAVGGPATGEMVARLAVDGDGDGDGDGDDTTLRVLAVEAAATLGSQVCTDAVMDALNDHDAWVRAGAVASIVERGDVFVDPLLAILASSRPTAVRSSAAAALGYLGALSVPGLIAALNGGDRFVTPRAALALTRMGGPGVVDLIGALDDAQPDVVEMASRVLRTSTAAVTALAPLARAPNAHIRRAVARVLGDAAPARAFRPLLRLLADSDAEVRAEATKAIARLGEDGVDALARLALTADDLLRDAASDALVAIGPPATRSLVLLATRVKESDRAALARMLARFDDPHALLAAVALGGAEGVRARSTQS
jgi:HEAT repeat protein